MLCVVLEIYDSLFLRGMEKIICQKLGLSSGRWVLTIFPFLSKSKMVKWPFIEFTWNDPDSIVSILHFSTYFLSGNMVKSTIYSNHSMLFDHRIFSILSLVISEFFKFTHIMSHNKWIVIYHWVIKYSKILSKSWVMPHSHIFKF